MTREQWLQKMIEALRPLFRRHDAEIPEHIRASCGWPSHGATAKRGRCVGECWSSKRSADGHYELFVSPVLSDSIEVLGTLVHELVHTVVGTDCGHKAPFRRVALAVGLEGKMSESSVGEELALQLEGLIERIGHYPHATLSPSTKDKKQTTRLLKATCPNCGYLVRVTRKWLDVGLPTCPCGNVMSAV